MVVAAVALTGCGGGGSASHGSSVGTVPAAGTPYQRLVDYFQANAPWVLAELDSSQADGGLQVYPAGGGTASITIYTTTFDVPTGDQVCRATRRGAAAEGLPRVSAVSVYGYANGGFNGSSSTLLTIFPPQFGLGAGCV